VASSRCEARAKLFEGKIIWGGRKRRGEFGCGVFSLWRACVPRMRTSAVRTSSLSSGLSSILLGCRRNIKTQPRTAGALTKKGY
jgi:hypothetical protein